MTSWLRTPRKDADRSSAGYPPIKLPIALDDRFWWSEGRRGTGTVGAGEGREVSLATRTCPGVDIEDKCEGENGRCR